MRGRTLAFAALLTLSVSLAQADAKSHIDDKIRSQEAKIQAVQQKLHEKRAKLGEARAKVGTLAEQLQQTNANIGNVRGRIGDLDAQMRSTQRKLAWTRVQLDAARKTLGRHNDALKRRLIDAYEHGDLGYIDVLLESRSFGDFVERWNDIRYIIKANQVTIRARRSVEVHVRGIEGSLVGTSAVLASQQAEAEQEHHALDALADQRKALLAAAAQEKNTVQSQVTQYEEMTAEEEAALEALIRQKQAEEEARKAAERRARQLAGEAVAPVTGAPGAVSWPVSGPITSPFGMRNHPTLGGFRLHAGIDIGASQGTTIGAAAAGRIIIAQYAGNCGNMITIDHGGGMATNYCHLSQIFVGVGQDVQRGQAIGAVGQTGDANGPHLHFEVRINGRPVDPLGYLR
ncbi:MAG: peptidoglycan DD-metalloendopeptidase family protein [Candidatus Velthaea sp.]